jgi:hypothetical protein
MDQRHARRVTLEEVVDERHDGNDRCRRSGEGEASEALDEGGDEGGGKVAMTGGKVSERYGEDEGEREGGNGKGEKEARGRTKRT